MGWRTAAKLLRLREQFFLPDSEVMANYCDYYSRTSVQNAGATPRASSNRANHNFTKGVEKEFQEEL